MLSSASPTRGEQTKCHLKSFSLPHLRVALASKGDAAMTDRIQDFLAQRRANGLDNGPCVVVDLEVVRDNYTSFASALPDTRVFYAVKANPDPAILDLLARLGSCFDTASVVEIQQVLATGVSPDRLSFGNTIITMSS